MYTAATAVLINSIYVLEKENSCITGRTSFLNSLSIVERMNPVGFLDSTYIAAAMIVYLHYTISVSWSLIIRLESNVLLFGCLFKLRSDEFKNIGSLNNVIPQYLRTGRFSGLRPGRNLCRLAWFKHITELT